MSGPAPRMTYHVRHVITIEEEEDMSDSLRGINLRVTPQDQAVDPSQVQNNAGGFVFRVTPEARLRRFLTLGTDGGTYYVGQKEHTEQNSQVVFDWARNRTTELVNEVLLISEAGRAPKQNPGIFALAAAASLGDEQGRRAAFTAIPRVCRTATTLFLFAAYCKNMRGWGQGFKKAMAKWYTDKSVDDLAYQVVKYRNREDMTHRDMLRLTHPKTNDEARKQLFKWITHPEAFEGWEFAAYPVLVDAFNRAQATTTVPGWVNLITNTQGLSWEMLPDAALKEPKVWEALILKGVPQTALMRQLPRLTKLGLFDVPSVIRDTVCAQLQDSEKLIKARVHPVNVLIAMKTYAQGRGMRGSMEWNPSAAIVDALDAAFYNAFGAVRKTDKRQLLALDVSGSMTSEVSGLPLQCREVTAAMALVTASVEPNTTIVGFTGGHYSRNPMNAISVLSISPQQRLNDAIDVVSRSDFGTTDCALPALWAGSNGYVFDAISIYTDNETWAGSVHPFQALQAYRNDTGVNVRQVVVGITAGNFTIADPRDALSLDISGFDSAAPNLIADFVAGDV